MFINLREHSGKSDLIFINLREYSGLIRVSKTKDLFTTTQGLDIHHMHASFSELGNPGVLPDDDVPTKPTNYLRPIL